MSQKTSWKNNAIDASGGISDAWDVFISWAGRFAAWILFACMISNIVEVVVTLPSALVSGVMVVQVITLDIAGFGLNTIAKQVHKNGDNEQKAVAKKAKNLATFLIALMVLTLALVTVGYLVPQAATIADMINKALILVRVVTIVLYMHTMHDLSEAAGEIKLKAVQIEQANDELALSNQQKIEEADQRVHDLSTVVDTLASSVHILVDRVDQLCTEQAVIVERVHKNVDMAVDTLKNRVDRDEFEKLAKTVNVMSSSVTEVNQNILQITQNLYNVSPPQPLARSIEEERFALPETAESHQIDARSDSRNTLPVPILDVPGVSSEKVQSVIAAFLSGTGWRQMPGNYSRTIKPIRDAFEASQNTENTDVYTHVDM